MDSQIKTDKATIEDSQRTMGIPVHVERDWRVDEPDDVGYYVMHYPNTKTILLAHVYRTSVSSPFFIEVGSRKVLLNAFLQSVNLNHVEWYGPLPYPASWPPERIAPMGGA